MADVLCSNCGSDNVLQSLIWPEMAESDLADDREIFLGVEFCCLHCGADWQVFASADDHLPDVTTE